MSKPRAVYQTDLSDEEWQLLQALLPESQPGRQGKPMRYDLREIINGLLYVLRGGIAWRLMPHDLPPWAAVYYHFRKWRKTGLWERVNRCLREDLREKGERERTPSAAIIDSQTVKASLNKGEHGYDGAKNIKGRKRHAAVDTLGLLLVVVVSAANVAERAGAKVLFEKLRVYPRLKLIWEDGGYQGADFSHWIAQTFVWCLEIVKRCDRTKGFKLLPRRWVVERTFGWLGNYRRLAKDYEERPETSESFIYLASSHLMLRRLAGSPIPHFRTGA